MKCFQTFNAFIPVIICIFLASAGQGQPLHYGTGNAMQYYNLIANCSHTVGCRGYKLGAGNLVIETNSDVHCAVYEHLQL